MSQPLGLMMPRRRYSICGAEVRALPVHVLIGCQEWPNRVVCEPRVQGPQGRLTVISGVFFRWDGMSHPPRAPRDMWVWDGNAAQEPQADT